MEKVEVGNCTYEVNITGSGNSSIILLSGYGMKLDSWNQIIPELEKCGVVFSYNRLGVGKSDKAKETQNGFVIVEALRELLQKKDITSPYLILGHSIGGLYTNLWARLYPNEIDGVVLVDSSHPDQEEAMRKYKSLRFVRVFNGLLNMLDSIFYRNGQFSEINSFEVSAKQILSSGEFPNIPLKVIAGVKKIPFEPSDLSELHINNQRDLASLSIYGKLVIAENSGHFPQVTEPQLVVNEVVSLLSRDELSAETAANKAHQHGPSSALFGWFFDSKKWLEVFLQPRYPRFK